MPTVSEIPTQHGPTDASGHLPTPRLLEVLTNKRLSPTAKVLYSLLDELGQGQPVVLNQNAFMPGRKPMLKTIEP